MTTYIRAALEEAAQALSTLMHDSKTLSLIESAAQTMVQAFEQLGRVFSCGNGGSMCDAMHFAEELSGRFRNDRNGLPASAINDPGHLSCVANDFGYEFVFSRYIECHAKSGDVLLAISTSGTSKSVVNAATTAKQRALRVIALTGKPHSPLGAIADYDICTPAGAYADRVQELHIKVIHIFIELIERSLFPKNYSG
ncbi:Phosphoheptose isomerase [Candidatus Entotheonellaceae bacterium PAL068K]